MPIQVLNCRIIGIDGKTIQKTPVVAGTQVINLEAITPGIYFVQIQNASDTYKSKLIVK